MIHSNENPDRERLEQLLNEKWNGALSPAGFAELQALLVDSAELQSAYWAMNAIHADLEWEISSKKAVSNEILTALSSRIQDAPTPVDCKGSPTLTPRHWWWVPALAAGVIGLLAAGWALGYWPKWKQSTVVAQAAPDAGNHAAVHLRALAADSRWSFGRPGEWNPEIFNYGDTVWIEQGLVEMRIGDTVGQLLAPAALELLEENRVRLLSGKIKVSAPAQADGFTVETPSAEVVDLGTVFSVEAADSGTDLVVYDGKVDLKVPTQGPNTSSNPVKTKQFRTGEAVRVDRNGTLSRIMHVSSSHYPSALKTSNRPPIVTSVTDNIVRDNYWTFYEIVPNGMNEDAQAFVDRFHEWNGITESGMPHYLVGGDYVKTFNDDKIADEYKMELVLSHAAVLYVLLDTRVAPPKWLKSSFAETGDLIGVDEDHHHRPGNDVLSEVGPGKSIEFTHSIWKMVVPAAATVVLGPNGQSLSDSDWHRSMYGVVAVPLEQPNR